MLHTHRESQGRNVENGENKLKFVQSFLHRWSRENVEELASCFVVSFLVNNELHFLNEASKSNPLLIH